jgi:hypothetical protein
VGLAQAELERRGIVTASITLLPEITRRIGVPRVLETPYPLGFPLGEPDNAELQRAVMKALLGLLPRDDVPVVEAWV